MYDQYSTTLSNASPMIMFLLFSLIAPFTLSQSPTAGPTVEPTIYPTTTLSPTLEPTILTQYPTPLPTSSTTPPTFSPSMTPTLEPTFNPTNAPSFSPTAAPTRIPTIDRAYDTYFTITYYIKYLENEYIEILLRWPEDMTNDITEIIEQSYFEVTGLYYQDFWLQISDFLGYKINTITEKDYPHFLILKDEITVGSKLICDKSFCYRLQLTTDEAIDFESRTQTKLRTYFRQYWLTHIDPKQDPPESQLIFEIESYGKLKVLYPAGPTPFEILGSIFIDNYIMSLLLLFMFFMFILSTFAYCHEKGICFLCQCCIQPMDSTVWNGLLIYGLQIIVFGSDINICLNLIFYEDFHNDSRVKYTAIACMVFLGLPYAINLFFGVAITSMNLIAKENSNAVEFFRERKCMFMLLIVICGGTYPVIYLLSSGIFGASLFCSGLTDFELRKLNKIKIIGTICLQNIPQICIQCVYASILHTVTPNIVFAMIVSILSIIFTPFRIKKQYGNKKRISYYIEIKIMSENEDEADVDAEGRKFELHKNKIGKICKLFCRALECDENNLEISRNSKVFFSLNFSKRQQKMINGSGVRYYITQFVENDINVRQIVKLLQESEHFLKNEFKRHYDLAGPYACIIKFKSASGIFTIEIDACKDTQTNFDELLNEMMNEKGLDYNNNNDRENFLNNLYGNTNTNTNTENNGENDNENNNEKEYVIELEPKNTKNKSVNEKQMYDSLILNQNSDQNSNSDSDSSGFQA